MTDEERPTFDADGQGDGPIAVDALGDVVADELVAVLALVERPGAVADARSDDHAVARTLRQRLATRCTHKQTNKQTIQQTHKPTKSVRFVSGIEWLHPLCLDDLKCRSLSLVYVTLDSVRLG